MKQMSRIFLLLSVALMAGCKLAVIVVEGGEVQSTGSGTCVVGNICMFDVVDPNFSETFTAVPNPGWRFVKWNKGGRMFCADSTQLTCTLSLVGTAGIEAIEKILASDNTFYLMPIFARLEPDSIMVDGREWAQVDLFTNLTWEEINAVCPEGVCAGILKGFDLTGWTWASVDDLNALFNHYVGSDVLGPGPDCYGEGHDKPWVDAFFDDGWRDHNFVPGYVSVGGRLRDSADYIAFLIDSWTPGMGSGGDGICTNEAFTGVNDPGTGAWFYRTP